MHSSECIAAAAVTMKAVPKPLAWYEFFAGGGMARLGLGDEWRCVFANEWCPKKAASYRGRFGDAELRVCDVAALRPEDLPGTADLVWASFPCQDLSLAGNGAGLVGRRSGTFRPFWELVRGLARDGRAPRIVVLENVVGTLTARCGLDFHALVAALAKERYTVGALVMDAARFVPQSRPRLFVVGLHADIPAPSGLTVDAASEPWHSKALQHAVAAMPPRLRHSWVWWNLPCPSMAVPPLANVIEEQPVGAAWHTREQTQRLLALMAPLHRARLREAQQLGERVVGAVYRRTRTNKSGERVQRAEIRFDGVAGCLRTPAGGSSRQTVVVVEGNRLRSRLLSPTEAARLMGVPPDYPAPVGANEAYHLFGDGVVVPVVAWLERHLLHPLACCGYMEAPRRNASDGGLKTRS
jgi:DNA (cytosine-5)-methyltransferase 1